MSVFVDTNVLVYARDTSDREKHRGARAWMTYLWETGSGRLSPQVLQEYYVTVTRKLQPRLPKQDARADVQDLLAWKPIPIGERMIEAAWSIEDDFSLSFWDALIVSAASMAGCDHLLTEDLQDGMRLGRLRVANPFHLQPGPLA